MKIIGITGGIGSGKSTLCKILVASGKAELYVADSRAKDLMGESETIREAIINSFGAECYTNSSLNRPHLASIAFSSQERLNQLNSIVHPAVKDDFGEWLKECTTEIAILESAILFESGFDKLVDIKIAVLAPTPLRIERVKMRDNANEEQILSRINSQLSDNELQERADMCVVNIFEDDLEASASRVIQFAEQWKQ